MTASPIDETRSRSMAGVIAMMVKAGFTGSKTPVRRI